LAFSALRVSFLRHAWPFEVAPLKMKLVREMFLIFRNAVLVTAAVALGFVIGDLLGVPVWLQGFFLIPAMLLCFQLSRESQPPLLKLIGFFVLISVNTLIVSSGLKFVPERFTLAYVIVSFVVPFWVINRYCERRFRLEVNKRGREV